MAFRPLNLGFSVLGALMVALPAFAQTHVAPPAMSIQDPSCVAIVSGRCLLKAVHRSIEMTVGGDRKLQVILKGAPLADGSPSPIVILMPVSDDLDGRIRLGEITSDEATRVWQDLANFDGTIYSLPDLATLKTDLGFPSNAVLSDDDLQDLCRAHIQRTLGVSPITAAYLAERMGVEATPVDDLMNERGELRASDAPDASSASASAGSVPAAAGAGPGVGGPSVDEATAPSPSSLPFYEGTSSGATTSIRN
jgi:hypothetical protein